MKEEVLDVVPINNGIPALKWTGKEYQLIKSMYAKGASDDEFQLFMYIAKTNGLDPLKKEIWCVKFKGQPAQIYASRDGHLTVAHNNRTTDGEIAFDGMSSGTDGDKADGSLKGWCEVYRKDMGHLFRVEVEFDEYDTGQALWKTKPKTMIAKVAESQCLRKAFKMRGFYAPEEMDRWEKEIKPASKKKPLPGNFENKEELSSKDQADIDKEFPPEDKDMELDHDTFMWDRGTYKDNPVLFIELPSKYIGSLLWGAKKTRDEGKYPTAVGGYSHDGWIAFIETSVTIKKENKSK